MTLRTWLLALFSLLVLAACLALPFIPEAAQPFDATADLSGDEPVMVILPSSLGLPMPEGLQSGDRAYLTDMTPETRSIFMLGSLNPPAGMSFDLPVRRADGVHHVRVSFMHVAYLSGTTANVLSTLAGYALTVLVAALGLLLLWRGSSQAALGVAIWCLGVFLATVFSTFPLPLPWCKVLGWCGSILDTLCTLVGLYMVADGLTAQSRPWLRRRLAHVVFGMVLVAYTTSVTLYNWHFYRVGTNLGSGIDVVVGLHIFAIMMSFFILGFGYRRADSVSKARIRWILFSLLGIILSYAGNLVAPRVSFDPSVVNVIGTVLFAMTFIGFAYAVLKHRLVSLQFVLNRALVYGLITSLVVGVFAALLTFLEHNAVSSGTNQFLALLIPLILGMGINSIKRKVDEYINAAFFKHRHKAEASLTHFARSSAFIEDPDKLLDLAADELYRNSRAQGVAVYLTQKGKAGPRLVRQQGPVPFQPKLGADDLAVLRLKAGDAEVDLHNTFSALGPEGYLYAFTVRSEVLGFIVVGPRPAEAYTPDERRLYGLLASQVGVALHALRLEEQRKLLLAIAKGAYKSMPKARAKAKALIEAAAV